MSRAMRWALTAGAGRLTPGARLTLVALAAHADHHGRGTYGPSAVELATQLDFEPRSVERHLAALREAGLIRPGDQSIVAHLEPRHRPVVYDLAITASDPTHLSDRRSDPTEVSDRDPSRVTPLDRPDPTEVSDRGPVDNPIRSDRGVESDPTEVSDKELQVLTTPKPNPGPVPALGAHARADRVDDGLVHRPTHFRALVYEHTPDGTSTLERMAAASRAAAQAHRQRLDRQAKTQ